MFTGFIICVLIFCVIFTASLCKVAREQEEIAEFKPKQVSVNWVKYPVPLDDDLQKYIIRLCTEYEISPAVVFAVIGTESNFQSDAIGDHGNAFGLMQIYRSVNEERMDRLGCTDLLNPYHNVLVGIDILAEHLNKGNGIEWALSKYVGMGGEECEYAEKVMRLAECISEGVMVVSE